MSHEWEDTSDEEEIERLMSDVDTIVMSAIKEEYFSVKEYERVQIRMKDLLEQGVFWLQRHEPKRFIYDIKDFLTWMCNLVGDKEKSDEF